MNIIQENPYRFLGVYSNSPIKERVANHNRLKAFLKVGKPVTYPLDLPNIFPVINRTIEAVTNAEAKLALPNDQLRYAQFWFLKITPFDDIAFNHLLAGNIDTAISIWEKKENVSSLQNRIVCALIQKDYTTTMDCVGRLYSLYAKDFVEAILGENSTISMDNIAHDFLDALCAELDVVQLLSYMPNQKWKEYISEKSVKPLIDILQKAVDTAKSSKKDEPSARLAAGVRLMNCTKDTLKKLQKLVTSDNLQYQMIADKLGIEILQCGIDYFNKSDEPDVAHKAMRLQEYALSIVVGKMAKERCKENVDILSKIIENLPPLEVFAEDKTIQEELKKFCQLPDKIVHAATLLNNTKPHLESIKKRLGATNAYYLKTSTQVVGNALHNIIEEVNYAQRDDKDDIFDMYSQQDKALSTMLRLTTVKSVLQAAWNATKIMDTFDMESDFKTDRYDQNRSILKNLCDQLGVSTAIYVPRQSTPQPSTTQPPVQKVSSPSIGNKKSISTSSSDNSGCIIGIMCVVLGAIIGGIVAGGGGAFFGALVGLGIYGKIAS